MPSYITPLNGEEALAEHVAQITENHQGLRNIPTSLSGINDAAAYALTLKNVGVGSKGLIIYAADGTTVLLQVDGSGVQASTAGGAAAPLSNTPGAGTVTPAMMAATAWTAFTPVIKQGVTITATITYAQYLLLGKLAVVQIKAVLSSTGTAANPVEIQSLPAAIAARFPSSTSAAGSFLFADASAANYAGTARMETANNCTFIDGGGGTTFGVNPAVQVASGDILSVCLSYEVA